MKLQAISAKVMAAVLTAGMIMTAAAPVFAAEDTNQPVSVIPDPGENEAVSVGNISVTEDTTSSNGFAAYVVAPQDSQAELDVEGNITAEGAKESEEGFIGTRHGAAAEAFDGKADLHVSGDVEISAPDSFSMGVYTISAMGTASVAVDGDVSVSSGSGIGINMEGGSDDASKPSSASVKIGGDVSVKNKYWAGGVQAGGADAEDISIDGDLTVISEEYEGTAILTGGVDSATTIRVGGDASGSTTGLQIVSYEEYKPVVDVLIEGTLSGKENPVLLIGEGGNPDIKLTAWKIEPNAEGKIVVSNEHMADAAAELEKNILYIIKVEQPAAGGSLALTGTTDSHGFAVAKEGETVTLKATVQNGYKLKSVLNGTTALTLTDENGNYYIVVPKGGGVTLSMILEQIQSGVIPTVPVVEQKKLIEEYELAAAGASAKISFYDDSTVEIILPDGTKVEGTFAFEDGKLTFNGIELDVTIDEDGTYHCTYVTAAGETIEFILNAEFVERLREATKD